MNPNPTYTLTSPLEAVLGALYALDSEFPSSRSCLLTMLNQMEQKHGGKMEWTARPPEPNAPQAMPDFLQDTTRSIRVHQAVNQVNLPHAQSAYNDSRVTQTVAESIAPRQSSTRAASNLNAVGIFSPDTPTGASQRPRGQYPDRRLQSQAMQPPTSQGWRQGPAHEHVGSYLDQTSVQDAPNLNKFPNPFASGYPATAPAVGPGHDALDYRSQFQSVTSSETWPSIDPYADLESYPTGVSFSPRDQYSGTPQQYAPANGTRAARPSTSSIYSTNTTTGSGRYPCPIADCEVIDLGIRGDYENHMNSHSEIKFRCTVPGCTQSYSAKKSLDRHIRDDHHICLKCESGPGFNTREELQTHDDTDHRQILCDRCGTNFGTMRELNLHKAAEHRDGTKCNVLTCRVIVASKGDLYKHWEKDHPEEKIRTQRCPMCHKTFWEPRQRKQHVCRVQSLMQLE